LKPDCGVRVVLDRGLIAEGFNVAEAQPHKAEEELIKTLLYTYSHEFHVNIH